MPANHKSTPDCRISRRSATAGLATLAIFRSPSAKAGDALAFRSLPKAAWVWDFTFQRAGFFLEQAQQFGVSTIFASIPMAERAKLLDGDAELISQLHQFRMRGIDFYAAAGDPSAVNRPETIAPPLQMLLDIQAHHGLFAGLHLDVEPHALPLWRTGEAGRVALSEKLVAFLATVRSQASRLPIDFAAHPMLANINLPHTGNALAAVCRQVDSVSLMAYRNSAPATVHLAKAALGVLNTSGRRWRMGVLLYAAREGQTSYFGFPREQILSEIADLHLLLRIRSKDTFYKGIAIEDMRGLYALFSS